MRDLMWWRKRQRAIVTKQLKTPTPDATIDQFGVARIWWKPVPDATRYRVRLYPVDDPSNAVIDQIVSDTWMRATLPYEIGRSYRVEVQAVSDTMASISA